MTPRLGLIAASGLILASLITIPAPVEARTDPTVWTTQSLASVTGAGTITRLIVDQVQGTEKLGVAYKVGNDIHVLRCDSSCTTASQWTVKNADAIGSTNALNDFQFAWIGGTHWALAALATGNVCTVWDSADDGATWTSHAGFAGNGCLFKDLKYGGAVGWFYFLVTDNNFGLSFGISTDSGASILRQNVISDNQGGSTAATATIGAASARMVSDSSGVTVYFQEAPFGGVFSNQGTLYEVNTPDTVFWTVPYTTQGGSTKAPITLTNCPADATAVTQGGVGLAGTPSDQLVWLARKTGASNQYLCTTRNGSNSDAYTSTNPATRIDNWADADGNKPLASNGQQYIAAYRQGTTNAILYKATSATSSWTTEYTRAADTPLFSLTTTPTKAYMLFIDNSVGGPLSIAGATMIPDVAGITGRVFCATSTDDTDYGYDDASSDRIATSDQGQTIVFNGNNNAPAWVGKSWGGVSPSASGMHRVRVFFNIRAQVDAQSSKFRATLTNTPATGSITAPTIDHGDLDHTGDFVNSVDVLFTETGNDWNARLFYTTGGGARTQIGAAFVGDDPNTATQYMLEVSTDASRSTRYLALKYNNATDILNVTIPVEAGKENAFWYSQYFIAESTTVFNAFTEVSRQGLSTCIYALTPSEAQNPNGDQGSINNHGNVTGTSSSTPTCSTVICTTADTVPAGFTVSAFNGFLGLVLVGMVAVGGSTAVFNGDMKGRAAGLVFGVFGMVGYLIALYFGLLPLWPLILLGVVALAVVLLRIKGGGS